MHDRVGLPKTRVYSFMNQVANVVTCRLRPSRVVPTLSVSNVDLFIAIVTFPPRFAMFQWIYEVIGHKQGCRIVFFF